MTKTLCKSLELNNFLSHITGQRRRIDPEQKALKVFSYRTNQNSEKLTWQ